MEAPVELAKHFDKSGSRTVLLSTSAVFDCLEPHMLADRPRAPRSLYGKVKAEAEEGILVYPGGTILRLTKVVTEKWNLIDNWIVALQRGEQIRAVYDHTFCPLELDHVVSSAVAVLESGEAGIFQVSGADDITYVMMANLLTTRLGQSASLVTGISASDAGIPDEEITLFTSLDSRRIAKLSGFIPPAPAAVIDHVFSRSIAASRSRI